MEIPHGLDLTSELFLADNQSAEAEENIDIFRANRDVGNLIAVFPCGDARQRLPIRSSLHVRSLGCGCPKQDYEDLLADRRLKGAMPLSHYNGGLLKEELLNEEYTCGARKVKSLQQKGLVTSFQGVQGFVARNVHHPNLVYQTLYAAFDISHYTDKLVLASCQDHTNGKITPMAVIRGSEIIEKSAGLQPYLEGDAPSFEEGKIELPTLTDSQIPAEFEQPLAESREQEKELELKYPDRKAFLIAQMPEIILLSTLVKPPATRYPGLYGIPGYYFQVGSPRLDLDYATLPTNSELHTLADQAEYPVSHAVKNYGVDGADFSTSRTFKIETGSMTASEQIAQYVITTKNWMRQFRQFPDTQIIIAEAVSGHARKIERYL